jgi:predicted Zn finger-like uncharacterized protein
MLIVCPSCSTSYDLTAASLGAAGRSVRCASCKTVWFARPQAEPAFADAAPDLPDLEASAIEEQVFASAATENAPEARAPAPDWMQATGNETDSDAADWIAEPNPNPPVLLPDTGGMGDGSQDMFGTADADSARGPDSPSIVPSEAHDQTFEPAPRRPALRSGQRRARMAPPERPARKSPLRPLPAAIAVLAVAAVAVLFWRTSIVRFAPQTASFYAAIGMPVNLRGTVFEDVRITQEMHEGIPVMVVEGRIVSTVNKPVQAQRLRFSLRDTSGSEIYSWTALPSRSIIEPGDSVPFRSRLASPPAEGRDVIVRFFNRRDAATAVR